MLHGYGASGLFQNLYLRLGDIADEEGFFIAAPDGTLDATQKRFWNATDLCCDFEKTGVDDVRYLTGLVSEIRAAYAIDPKRIYIVGHSNGGAMAYRLACDASEQFAAIVSLAGPFFEDVKRCAPSSPVAVQHMHGTADEVVPYDGGPLANVHAGVVGKQPSAPSIASDVGGARSLHRGRDRGSADRPGRQRRRRRDQGDALRGLRGRQRRRALDDAGLAHVPGNLVADSSAAYLLVPEGAPQAVSRASALPADGGRRRGDGHRAGGRDERDLLVRHRVGTRGDVVDDERDVAPVEAP